MSKRQEKYIGLVCQNESLFQNIFNKIYLNLPKKYYNTTFHLISFNKTIKTHYDYLIFVDSYTGFNINELRSYLNCNDSLLILNNDLGETGAFLQIKSIVTYGNNETSEYLFENLTINNNIITFELIHNNHTYPFYYITSNYEDIYSLISIIILLFIENLSYSDIKFSIQK